MTDADSRPDPDSISGSDAPVGGKRRRLAPSGPRRSGGRGGGGGHTPGDPVGLRSRQQHARRSVTETGGRVARPHPPADRALSEGGQDRSDGEGLGSDRVAEGGRRTAGSAERPAGDDRRCGVRRLRGVRRSDSDTDLRAASAERSALQPIPHHRAVFAVAGGTAHRAQSSRGVHRHHHGVLHPVPRIPLHRVPQRRHARRGADRKRLRHSLVR